MSSNNPNGGFPPINLCDTKKINIKKIKITDIKKQKNFDSSDIFNENITFLYKNNYKYYFKRHSKSLPLTLIIEPYDNENKDIDDINRPENINKKMLYILSDIVLKGLTRHIILPILNFDIEIDKIQNEIVKSEIKELKKGIENKEIHNIVSVNLTEHFGKLDRLDNYLEVNCKTMSLEHWKVLFFQLIYTVAQIQNVYPTFKHNFISPYSIELFLLKNNDNSYILNNIEYEVPPVPFEIKLSHFNKSCIKNIIENTYVKQFKFINYEENKYFDIHYFFNLLLGYENTNYIHVSPHKKELINFIHSIIPEKFRTKSNNSNDFYLPLKTKIDEKYNPENILKENPFFKSFINNNKSLDKPIDVKNNSSEVSESEKIILPSRTMRRINNTNATDDTTDNSDDSDVDVDNDEDDDNDVDIDDDDDNYDDNEDVDNDVDDDDNDVDVDDNDNDEDDNDNDDNDIDDEDDEDDIDDNDIDDEDDDNEDDEDEDDDIDDEDNKDDDNEDVDHDDNEDDDDDDIDDDNDEDDDNEDDDKISSSDKNNKNNNEYNLKKKISKSNDVELKINNYNPLLNDFTLNNPNNINYNAQLLDDNQVMALNNKKKTGENNFNNNILLDDNIAYKMSKKNGKKMKKINKLNKKSQSYMMPNNVYNQEQMIDQTGQPVMDHMIPNGNPMMSMNQGQMIQNEQNMNSSMRSFMENSNYDNTNMGYNIMPNIGNNMGYNTMSNMGYNTMPNMEHNVMPNMEHNAMLNMGHNTMPNMGHNTMPNMGHNTNIYQNNMSRQDEINNKLNQRMNQSGGNPFFFLNDQKGGEHISLKKTPLANDPNMPNEKKRIFQKKMEYRNKSKNAQEEVFKRNKKPLAELTLYQQDQQSKQPNIPPLMYPMNNPFYYPPYTKPNFNQITPYGLQYFYPYVNKKYNISVPNPNGSHQFMSNFYEDILPDSIFDHTSNTLDERLLRFKYLKKKFTKIGDGENISLNTNIKNGILNRIKLQILNPQMDSILSSNPYKDLPYGFLIYNSCYPMQYDKSINNSRCAKNSVGMNVRIYELNIVDYNAFKLKNKNKEDFDTWRDIIYYEYIRKEIIEPKLCPNFVILFTYHIDNNCDINFEKLYNISGAKQINDKKILKLIEEELNPPKPITMLSGGNKPIRNIIKEKLTRNIKPEIKNNNKINGKDYNIRYDNKESKALIALTESPTYNIYKWASEEYEYDGILKEMVHTGFHKDEVWLSILFQLMVALYAMQIKDICIENFSLEDNVYIKDINTKDMKNGHWVYNIDGINYYIPNYGYIVLIDSKYKDIEIDKTLQDNFNKKIFKINGKCFGSKNVKDKVFKIFQKCINTNNFGQKRMNVGFHPPGNNILNLINKINNDTFTPLFDKKDIYNSDINKNIISYYIHKYMKKYLHNKVGTLLTKDEEENKVRYFEEKGDINVGTLVKYENESNYNLWGICVGIIDSLPDKEYIICIKDKDKNYINKINTKSSASIEKYNEYNTDIEQKYDGNSNFDICLEKYRLHINMMSN